MDTFGEEILQNNGEIDRKKLGTIVFSDPEQLTKLNRIMHPRMAGIVSDQLEELRSKGNEVAVVEAALLYEAGWDSLVDEVWATDSPVETVIERLQSRNGMSADEVLKRIDSQMDRAERLARAQVVLDNSGDVSDLEKQITSLWEGRIQKKDSGKVNG